MTDKELIIALRHTAPDNHRCLGCGHEHNCGIHGCAINRQAAEAIETLKAERNSLEFQQDCLELSVDSLNKTVSILRTELVLVKAERDAAVAEINDAQPCFACTWFSGNGGKCFGAGACRTRMAYELAGEPLPHADLSNGKSWLWRGLQGREGR